MKKYQTTGLDRPDARELTVPEQVSVVMADVAADMREGLLALAVGTGLQVMSALMEADVTALAGPRGKHNPERVAGTTRGAIRLGARRLSRLQAGLSERDHQVLQTVGQLRLATSRHLEALHYGDAATPLTAARKARRSLQRLVELGLLHRLQRQIGGLHAGSAAFVYALTERGQRVLGLPGPRRRSHEPAWPFIAHTLAIADLVVALHRASREAGRTLLDLQTEPTAWRAWTNLGGGRETLKPDLYLSLGVGDDELRWFVEVDRGTEHRPALLRKCRAYQGYYEAGIEQTRDGVFPRVVWVVPDAARATALMDVIAGEPGLTQALFAVVTADDAVTALLELEASNERGGAYA